MSATRWMLLSASALALAGCGSKTETNRAETTTVTANGETATVVNDDEAAPVTASAGQTFANAAAASDAFEIGTSQLAATQSQSAAIKKFADAMVRAHTESTAKLKAAAGGLSPAVTPDATLNADQQASYEKLKALSGAEFDKAYAAAQVDAHQKTLAALKANAANSEVPQALRDFATKLIPTVTAHLNMAKGLKP